MNVNFDGSQEQAVALGSTTVDAMVLAQCELTPDRVAVRDGNGSLTYRKLSLDVERLARGLLRSGIGRGDMCGILLERSPSMVSAMLAVMRVGAAYIPLDPEFPNARLRHMIDDSKLSLTITEDGLGSAVPLGSAGSVRIDELRRLGEVASEPPGVAADDHNDRSGDLAYVLYTSGSTGKPKGVAVEQRAVCNFLASMRGAPGCSQNDVLLAVTTLSFDIAALELLLPLTVGACVVIASAEEANDGDRLRQLVEAHGVTLMQATPSTWRLMLDAGWTGTGRFKALCGGEALPLELAKRLSRACSELWNMYGPTETTIWSTCCKIPKDADRITIGRPIANTSIYVLDKNLRPVPRGVPGEIFIGGAGVARCYLHRPDLTAERFLEDPFCATPGSRMYRTGDIGRVLASGELECRGRVDQQIKLRGYRIELGEVEASLDRLPGVRQSACRIVRRPDGNDTLVAYLEPTAGQSIDVVAAKDQLRGELPKYMIPQRTVIVETLPLTPNGKIDRAALPEPEGLSEAEEPYVEPSTDTERAIAEILATSLGIDRVSVTASFFDVGGHSVLAARAVSRIRTTFRVEASMREFFAHSSARELAAIVDARSAPVPHGAPDETFSI